jgi:hypothetical protein
LLRALRAGARAITSPSIDELRTALLDVLEPDRRAG